MKNIYVSLMLLVVLMCCGCGRTTSSIPLTDGENAEVSKYDSSGTVDNDTEFNVDKADAEEEVKLTEFEKLFADGPLVAYDENGLAGYIDINGNYVIAPQFEKGKDFHEGYAAVMDPDTKQWGYIDTSGNYVISPMYVEASIVYNGTAIVKTDYTLCGLIDISGKYIIEPVYRNVSFYKDGYALVQYKDDVSGEIVYHFIDESGSKVFDEYADAYLFEKGIAAVRLLGTSYFYMQKDNGDQMVFDDSPVNFNSCCTYKEYSEVNKYLDFDNIEIAESDWGAEYQIGKDGRTLSPMFDQIGASYSDIFSAGERNEYGAILYGYVDKDFNWVIPPVYDSCSEFIGDYAWAVEWLDYERSVEWANSGDIYSNWYILDKQGNRVLDGGHLNHNGIGISMANIKLNKLFEHPLPAYNYNTQMHGYVNQNYEEKIPFIYDETGGFASDGSYAYVKYNGRWGMIDCNGNWLIEPKYSRLGNEYFAGL